MYDLFKKKIEDSVIWSRVILSYLSLKHFPILQVIGFNNGFEEISFAELVAIKKTRSHEAWVDKCHSASASSRPIEEKWFADLERSCRNTEVVDPSK